jgi:ABC-type bacteriocin/lantibiotic exporter with double-glycine peptidase domain
MPDSSDQTQTGPADAALASFVLLAQFLGVPADPHQIHHDRGQGDRHYQFDDLIRIAKKLGLMARRKEAPLAELSKLPLPALVSLNEGDTAILLKIDDSGGGGPRYMVLRSDGQRPEVWSESDIAERRTAADDQSRAHHRAKACVRHFLVYTGVGQVPEAASRRADRQLLSPASRLGFADFLPAGDRQGAGQSGDEHA